MDQSVSARHQSHSPIHRRSRPLHRDSESLRPPARDPRWIQGHLAVSTSRVKPRRMYRDDLHMLSDLAPQGQGNLHWGPEGFSLRGVRERKRRPLRATTATEGTEGSEKGGKMQGLPARKGALTIPERQRGSEDDRVPRLSERCLLARPCGAQLAAKHGRAQTTGLTVAPSYLQTRRAPSLSGLMEESGFDSHIAVP